MPINGRFFKKCRLGAFSASDMAKQDRRSAVHAQKLVSHVLFASIYRNSESGTKLVSRVQIPVEASSEKNGYVKN